MTALKSLEMQKMDEKTVKDIHAMLMENILVGGVYRQGH